MGDAQRIETPGTTNRELLLPYMVPYLTYVGIAAFSRDTLSVEISYLLRLVIVPGLIYWAWKWFVPLTGPETRSIRSSIGTGLCFGIAGLVVWCLFLLPFVDIRGEAWSGTAFCLRLASASLLVPVFEEMLIRGYIFRVAFQWDTARRSQAVSPLNQALDRANITSVPPGAWTAWSIIISNFAFALGHQVYEWPAALAYGLVISWVWIVQKDLLSCIVAHATTNLLLGIYVYTTGLWGFW